MDGNEKLGSLPLFLSLVLLLLAFFIFLNSISTFEVEKSDKVIKSVRSSFPSLGDNGEGAQFLGQDGRLVFDSVLVKRLEKMFGLILPEIQIQVDQASNQVFVDIPNNLVFISNTAGPRPALEKLIFDISSNLKSPEFRNNVEVRILFGYKNFSTDVIANGLLFERVNKIVSKIASAGGLLGSYISIGYESGHADYIRFRFNAVEKRYE